jgi:plasmid stabilization system protein ParE
MRVVYSRRSTQDLEAIATYYRTVADANTAAAIGERIERVITRLGNRPQSAPQVLNRTDVRVALVLRYPYKIFYRVRPDAIEILHIRHTAQRPWQGIRE